MLKKRILGIFLVGMLVTSCLAGCGNNSMGTSDAKKDTLTVAIGGDPPTLDPHASSTSSSVNNLNPVYETLVRYDEHGELKPLLAKSWKRLDDLRWEFKLRDDVYFHNGDKMTSKDVMYSLKRATGPDGVKVAYIMAAINYKECKALDDYTVIIATHKPFAPLPGYLPYIGAVVVSEKEFTEHPKEAPLHPVGTGPFKFVSWKKNDRCVYVRNDQYWGDVPKYKNLIIRTIVESNSRVIELESGNIDIALDVPATDAVSLEKNPEVQVLKSDSTVVEYLNMNVSKPPLDNVDVRRAIDYAINEKALEKAIYRGSALYAPTLVAPNMKYFDDSDTDCRYDVEKAKELLKKAGVKDLHLKLITSESKNRINIAIILQDMLAKAGIKVDIQSYESGTFYNIVDSGDTQLFLVGFGAVGFPEPDNNVYGPFSSTQIPSSNMGFYKDAKMDEMLEAQRVVSDGPEREKILKDIQKHLRQEVPVIPLANTQQIVGVRKNVKGFVPTPAASHFYHKVFFTEE